MDIPLVWSKVSDGISIKTPGVSLIVAPGAVLKGSGETKFPVMIKVVRANEVKVFNLGTLDTGRRPSRVLFRNGWAR